MTSTIELLEAFKAAKRITSDNGAAIALGTGRQTVSNWRTGSNHPSPAMIEKMADGANADALKWALRIEADRTKNHADRKAWLRWSQRVAAVTLTLAALTGPALLAARSLPIVSNRAGSRWSAGIASRFRRVRALRARRPPCTATLAPA